MNQAVKASDGLFAQRINWLEVISAVVSKGLSTLNYMLPAVFVFLCCLFSFSSLGKFLNGSVWPPLCSQTDPSGPKAQCQQYTNCYLITSKFGFPGPRPKWARPLILLILRPTHPNHSFSRQIKMATFVESHFSWYNKSRKCWAIQEVHFGSGKDANPNVHVKQI